MPRRKQAFINRSTATTYQLVHHDAEDSAGGPKHTLVPMKQAEADTGSTFSPDDFLIDEAEVTDTQPAGAIDASELEGAYVKRDYEVGEFGFPDDGYDYAKHFKTIGGGGGVFMDALSGMPDSDAVVGSVASGASGSGPKYGDGITFTEDVIEKEGGLKDEAWKTKEDILLAQEAIEQIKRDRKHNADLDEVFAALDSEGELESSSNDGDGAATLEPEQLSINSDGDDDGALLEDDFIASAQQADDIEAASELIGVLEEYREPRVLDEQFEKFMRAYELDSTDRDSDEEPDESALDVNEDLEDFKALMSSKELDSIAGGGFLEDLAALKVSAEGEAGEHAEVPELVAAEVDSALGKADAQMSRAAEYEEFANAEFERGMNGLLDSYNRISAVEALEAIDGVDVAREAIARDEEEERAKREERIELGLGEESDGHDSELESAFDEVLEERDDRWDCETILSTYSNLDNHPSVIDAPAGGKRRSIQQQPIIRLDPRTQAPIEYMPSKPDVAPAKDRASDFGSRRDTASEARARPRDETKDEKKARKAAVKELARERRALKSEMKKAFGSEHVKQNRHATALGKSKVAMHF